MKPSTKEYIEKTKQKHILVYKDKIIETHPHEKSHAFLIKMNEFYEKLEKRKVKIITCVIDQVYTSCTKKYLKQSLKNQFNQFRKDYIKDYLKSHNKLICQYCYRELINTEDSADVNKPHYTTLDHIIPTSKDGDMFNPSNILISCKECNGLKNDQDELKYRMLLLINCLCKNITNHQLDIFSNFTYQPKLLTLLRCYVKCWIKNHFKWI